MEVATSTVPDGYMEIDLGGGFQDAFGPIFADRLGGRMGFRIQEWHCNPVGTLHGGALATFADSLVAMVKTGAEPGAQHTPTITLSIDFMAPALVGEWVEAKVTLLRATRSMLFVQGVLTADGGIFARSNAIYRKGKAEAHSFGERC